MEITTEIDKKNNIRKRKLVGSCSKSVLLEKLSVIHKGTDFQPNMNVFWDLSRASISSFSLDDIMEVASFVKEHWPPTEQQKVALMAPEVLTKLISKKIAKELADQRSISARVFDNQEEAFNWLNQE